MRPQHRSIGTVLDGLNGRVIVYRLQSSTYRTATQTLDLENSLRVSSNNDEALPKLKRSNVKVETPTDEL